MAYSIVAKDKETGQLGVAVASRFFAVGALVPYIRGGRCAVATQAFISPVWGREVAARLAVGERADAVLADIVSRDRRQALRQIHMIDSYGAIAAHTGAATGDWAGHRMGDAVSVAGNRLAGPDVVENALEAYRNSLELSFAERLLAAMDAAEAAGGDRRGRQSAALLIYKAQDHPWLDLRCDDHEAPLVELRRLLAVAGERFVFFSDALPTREAFSGAVEPPELLALIADEERRRAAAGYVSPSRAV